MPRQVVVGIFSPQTHRPLDDSDASAPHERQPEASLRLCMAVCACVRLARVRLARGRPPPPAPGPGSRVSSGCGAAGPLHRRAGTTATGLASSNAHPATAHSLAGAGRRRPHGPAGSGCFQSESPGAIAHRPGCKLQKTEAQAAPRTAETPAAALPLSQCIERRHLRASRCARAWR